MKTPHHVNKGHGFKEGGEAEEVMSAETLVLETLDTEHAEDRTVAAGPEAEGAGQHAEPQGRCFPRRLWPERAGVTVAGAGLR